MRISFPPGQPVDATLTALAAYNTNGLLTQTSADTFVGRSIAAGTGVGVSNGDGVSGNPTVSLSHLGLQALTDPNADRVAFWDDSAGAFEWLTMGTNLSITGTTLNATGGGGVAWGAITGTLSSQTDLQTALDGKQPVDALLTAIAASTDPVANGAYALSSSPASALSWNTSPNFKGPTPFVNALAPQFFVSNSTATTTGSITTGTAALTVLDSSSWLVGQGIYIVGAGAAGAVLETTVSAIPSGTSITLATNASTTVGPTAAVGHSDTAGIQAALDFAVSANVGSAGKVYLPSGIYNVSGITIPHECYLVGNGQRNTTLISIPGATALGVVMITGTSKGCGLFDLTVDGNKSASPAPVGAALYMTSTLTGGLRAHVIENVDVSNAVTDGFTMVTTGSNRIIAIYCRNIYASSNNQHGFNLADSRTTDSLFVGCSTGLNGYNGFQVLGGTNQFIGCSADDSGQVDATTYGDGWAISGSGAVGNTLSGCRSANNLRHSIYFTGANETNVVNLKSYDPRGDHVHIAGGTDNAIHCAAVSPFTAATSDSMLNAAGGSGNVLYLTWPTDAITATALTGANLTSQIIQQNGAYYGAADLTLLDGADLVLGTTTGTKIGTATSQKLGFFNATPIVQNTSTTDLRTGLVNLGLFASGGASPLNLNGGALTAATATLSGMTLGSVVFASTSGLLEQDNANFFWDNTSNLLGIGTNAPANKIHIVNDGAAGVQVMSDAYVSSAALPALRFRRSRGSVASPSAVTTNDGLGGVSVAGRYDASNWSGAVGQFRFLANEAFSSTNQGTYFDLSISTDGTAGTLLSRIKASTRGVIFNADAEAARSTTNGVGVIDLYNASTAPVGTLTNGVSLYATSGEFRVMDAAGNSTLLSPHDRETNEWVYDSVLSTTGKRLRIDVERMFRKLDEMLGGGYIHESTD